MLPTGVGGVVHLFVVCGYQGSEEDSEKLSLTDKLLRAVLAEAQVVCGSAAAYCRWLECRSLCYSLLGSGYIVWSVCCDLALAYSVGAGLEPDMTCKFKLNECAGCRRDSAVACPRSLAASTVCRVKDRWFTPHFFLFAEFSIRQWTAEMSCPRATELVWPACWVDTPDKSASSSSWVVQDIWDIYREELGVVHPVLSLHFGPPLRPIVWMIFGVFAEAGLLQAYRRAGKLFLAAAPCKSGGADWEVGVFVEVLLVSCIGQSGG